LFWLGLSVFLVFELWREIGIRPYKKLWYILVPKL